MGHSWNFVLDVSIPFKCFKKSLRPVVKIPLHCNAWCEDLWLGVAGLSQSYRYSCLLGARFLSISQRLNRTPSSKFRLYKICSFRRLRKLQCCVFTLWRTYMFIIVYDDTLAIFMSVIFYIVYLLHSCTTCTYLNSITCI